MDAIDIYEFNSQAISLLDEREAELEMPYWMTKDEGITHCESCIKIIKPDAEWIEDYGGGYDNESDSTEFCERCGKMLQCTLTDYGVDQGLSSFGEFGLDWDNAHDCYELARVAHGLLRDDEKRHKELYDIFMASVNKPAEWIGINE